MTNPYYTPSGNPGSHSKGVSALVRGEFGALQAAFDAVEGVIGSGATTENARALAAEALLAPLASPHFTGTPTVPTAANGTSTTQAASTAFVMTTRPEQLAPPTGDFSMGNNKIVNLASPSLGTDAANKNYVDGLGAGMKMMPTAAAATTDPLPANVYANGTLGVGATITLNSVGQLLVDGNVPVEVDMLILVRDESAAQKNGLYKVTVAGDAGTQCVMVRDTNMDQAAEFSGALVPVSGGMTYFHTNWLCNPSGAVTVGTTPIPFTQMNAATSLTGGANIQVAGNVINLIASPALSGNPTAPTRVTDDSTTSIATTAFVAGQASNATPAMNGAAAAGVSPRMARSDHAHPVDTSRYAASNPQGFQTATQVGAAIGGKQDALGFTPIEQGGGTDQTTTKIHIGWSGVSLKCQVAGIDLGAIPTANYPSGFATVGFVSATYMPLAGGTFGGTVAMPALRVTASGANITGGITVQNVSSFTHEVFFNGSSNESASGMYIVPGGLSSPNLAWTFGISAHAAGGMTATGFLTFSDGRLKDSIRDLTPSEGVDWVLRGRPRRYLLGGKPSVGFVAQEDLANGREEAVGQLPSDDKRVAVGDGFARDGYRLIRDYQIDIAFLTAALQNALGRIAALEARGT